jgi:hypothetical protein
MAVVDKERPSGINMLVSSPEIDETKIKFGLLLCQFLLSAFYENDSMFIKLSIYSFS